MRRRAALATAVLLTVAPALGTDPGPAGATTTTSARGTTILVNTAPGSVGARLARARLAAQDARVLVQWPEIGVTVALAPRAAAEKVATAIRRSAGVVSAGVSGSLAAEAPRVARVRAARPAAGEVPGAIAAAAKAPDANALATGRGVTVAVADTGVIDESSELAGRVDLARSGSCTRGGVYTTGNGTWRPAASTGWQTHGTEVASIVAGAHDGVGMRGIAPEARIVAIRVVDDQGDIYPESSICAAMAAARMHLPVANHSYGLDSVLTLRHELFDPRQPDQQAAIQAVTKAFSWSRSHGVLNVVATGNAGEDQSDKPHMELPASEQRQGPVPARLRALLGEVPGVMGVGESLADGEVAGASTVGFGIVDVSTVGAGMVQVGANRYDTDAGTSFASPAVAGTAALVRQLLPKATPAQLQQLIENSAIPTGCAHAGWIYTDQPCRARGQVTNFFGHGRLDALAAVRLARRTRD